MSVKDGIDAYQAIEEGRTWHCPRCDRDTRQYPAMSHALDHATADYPRICSDCGNDEDYQRFMSGVLSPVAAWPVRHLLQSLVPSGYDEQPPPSSA